jgi:hypothetical protein
MRYMEVRGYSSIFLGLGIRWRWVVLYPWGKSPRYQLDRRLGWPQSRSRRCGEEKNLALPRMKPGTSSSLPIAISTHNSTISRTTFFHSIQRYFPADKSQGAFHCNIGAFIGSEHLLASHFCAIFMRSILNLRKMAIAKRNVFYFQSPQWLFQPVQSPGLLFSSVIIFFRRR